MHHNQLLCGQHHSTRGRRRGRGGGWEIPSAAFCYSQSCFRWMGYIDPSSNVGAKYSTRFNMPIFLTIFLIKVVQSKVHHRSAPNWSFPRLIRLPNNSASRYSGSGYREALWQGSAQKDIGKRKQGPPYFLFQQTNGQFSTPHHFTQESNALILFRHVR